VGQEMNCGKAQAPQGRRDMRRSGQRVWHEMGADDHERGATDEERKGGLRAQPADDETRAEARHNKAQRAPQPHFAVV
jgi:hypothetical protein